MAIEKREFDQRITAIQSLRTEAMKFKSEFAEKVNSLTANANAMIETLSKRDDKFFEYLYDVSEFSYSDLTVSSELFPGVRTVSEMADPEEMKAKTDKMKTAVSEIENTGNLSSLQSNNVRSDLKYIQYYFDRYVTLLNQIYDLECELLEDMDSIYDISDIRRSVVY